MKSTSGITFDVYRYTDPREIVVALYEAKRRANPRYSLRAWTRQLGFKNPSLISQICKGERRLSLKIAQQIAATSGFGEKEGRYLELLVLRDKARLPGERALYEDLLRSHLPEGRTQVFPVDRFRLIADWQNLAILEMLALRDAGGDVGWFARRLGGKVTHAAVELALKRMERLGLVCRAPNGRWKRSRGEVVSIEPAAMNLAIQSHHAQMLARATEALPALTLDQREFRSTTLSIRKSSLPELRKLLTDFHQAALNFAVESDGDETFQLNTQLFQLTQNPEEVQS